MKTKLFSALAIAILACSCAGKKSSEGTFTVMTYNIGSLSKYEGCSAEGIASVIKAEDPVLVGLNELDSCNTRHNTDQLKDIAEALGGWNFSFSKSLDYKGGAYGNGVVSSKPIIARYRIELPRFEGSEIRSVAVVETEDMVFAATHLEHTSDAVSRSQAAIINDWFAIHYTGYDKPVILCGDLNSTPTSSTLIELRRLWNVLSVDQPTHSTENPRICIDYVLSFKTARQVKVLDSKVVYEEKGINVARESDHFPVMVKFKVLPKQESLTFVHMTDTQIGFKDETPFWQLSRDRMNAAVDVVNAIHPSMAFITGDLINDAYDTLQNRIYVEGKARFNPSIPVYEVPGNHDIRGYSEDKHAHYMDLRGYDRFSIEKDGHAFVGFDTNCIKDGAKKVEAAQLEWLEGELAKYAGAKSLNIFIHCPVIRENIYEKEYYFNFPMDKRYKYISLFKKYGVDAVYAGHTHQDYYSEYEGIKFITAGPVGSPLKLGYTGFNIVNIGPSGIIAEFVATPGEGLSQRITF